MMKKIILSILLLSYLVSNAQQIKCFRSPMTWNLSLGTEMYMQQRDNQFKSFPGFSSVDLIGSLEYKDWSYSIGVGYTYDEEIIGYEEMTLSTMSHINTLYVDSTYWVGNQMYIYHEEIKIYDSVSFIQPVLVNTEYQYFKIPIELKRKVYNYWDIDIYAKFKGNFMYEIDRKIETLGSDEVPSDFNMSLEPRKKKFYYILGIGPEANWNVVNYKKNSSIKNSSMIKKITIFLSFMIYLQPDKFQPIYKSTYLSFGLGVRVFTF